MFLSVINRDTWGACHPRYSYILSKYLSTYTEHVTNRILTKKDDEYIYEDGSLLDTGGEKDTCVIMCLTVKDK
jgi:hypothetical protein